MEGCCSEVSRIIAADTELEGGSKKQRRLEQENRVGRGPKRACDNYNSNKWLRWVQMMFGPCCSLRLPVRVTSE